MGEVLVKFDEPIAGPRGKAYFAQAVGKEVEDGLWEGWIEFQTVAPEFDALASGRETTQPNRANLEYWAQGLTEVYLEGALDRAISLAEPPLETPISYPEPSLFTAPASRIETAAPASILRGSRAILDPFQVYAQGEEILRSELNALSREHVVAIATTYRIGDATPSGLKSSATADLIEAIIAEARDRQERITPGPAEFRADL